MATSNGPTGDDRSTRNDRDGARGRAGSRTRSRPAPPLRLGTAAAAGYLLLSSLGVGSCETTCPAPPVPGPNPPTGILLVGHSQVNHRVPGYLDWLHDSAGLSRTVERQVIGGGNLEEAYVLHGQTGDVQDPALDPDGRYLYFPGRFSDKGADALAELATGDYDALVVTEEHGLTQAQARQPAFMSAHGVTFPPQEHVNPGADAWLLATYQPTYGIASGLGLHHRAAQANPAARTFLYENWFPVVNGATHCTRIDDGDPTKTLAEINSWRRRIVAYAPAWEGLSAEMHQRRGTTVPGFSYGSTVIPDTTVACGAIPRTIPVGRALSVLTERICAGQVPGLTNPNELFLDHAHASSLGDFFVAGVIYAAVRNQSPAGIVLAGDGIGRAADGSTLDTPDPSLVPVLGAIAWDVVRGAAVASADPIASCPALATASLPEPQLCIDPGDDETIPFYD